MVDELLPYNGVSINNVSFILNHSRNVKVQASIVNIYNSQARIREILHRSKTIIRYNPIAVVNFSGLG